MRRRTVWGLPVTAALIPFTGCEGRSDQKGRLNMQVHDLEIVYRDVAAQCAALERECSMSGWDSAESGHTESAIARSLIRRSSRWTIPRSTGALKVSGRPASTRTFVVPSAGLTAISLGRVGEGGDGERVLRHGPDPQVDVLRCCAILGDVERGGGGTGI